MPPKQQEHEISPEEVKAFFNAALESHLMPIRHTLCRLRHEAPQSLVIEGGSEAERTSIAFWYAALLNCPNTSDEGPCLECPTCMQVGARFHQNVSVLDGTQGHIAIDDVLEVRSQIGDAPHGEGKRVVLILEAQNLAYGDQLISANALLKSMEEPRPWVKFLLLAPQRNAMLPTLVSRGWVLTLPWQSTSVPSQDERLCEWLDALAEFCVSGRGWMPKTAVKNALDGVLVQKIISEVQKSLSASMRGDTSFSKLSSVFAKLSSSRQAYIIDILAQGQESLKYNVNPALVADWMAVRMYSAIPHTGVSR